MNLEETFEHWREMVQRLERISVICRLWVPSDPTDLRVGITESKWDWGLQTCHGTQHGARGMYVSDECSSPLPAGSELTDTASLARSYQRIGASWDRVSPQWGLLGSPFILTVSKISHTDLHKGDSNLTTVRQYLRYCPLVFLTSWPHHQKSKQAFPLNVTWLLVTFLKGSLSL